MGLYTCACACTFVADTWARIGKQARSSCLPAHECGATRGSAVARQLRLCKSSHRISCSYKCTHPTCVCAHINVMACIQTGRAAEEKRQPRVIGYQALVPADARCRGAGVLAHGRLVLPGRSVGLFVRRSVHTCALRNLVCMCMCLCTHIK
jgi:hypothetical protein